MTADPTPDCINCATGWADGPLCCQHANDQIERLKSALAGRTQSCSQCNASAAEIERLQAETERLLDLIDATDLPGGSLRAAARGRLSDDR